MYILCPVSDTRLCVVARGGDIREERKNTFTQPTLTFPLYMIYPSIYQNTPPCPRQGHNTLSSPIDALLPQPVVHMKGDTIIAVLLSLGIALISEMTKSSSASTSSNQEDVRVNGGRALNATALRGIQRVWAHSHNDEMQVVPLVCFTFQYIHRSGRATQDSARCSAQGLSSHTGHRAEQWLWLYRNRCLAV
jgi:hypothetical protein